MTDQQLINERRSILCDRLTPEELIELLGVTTEEVFDKFTDECLEIDLDDLF